MKPKKSLPRKKSFSVKPLKKRRKKYALHECPYCRSGLGSKCYGKKYPCENA